MSFSEWLLLEDFQTWFKNSKVVDQNGKPKVVYHGSRNVFSKFSHQQSSRNLLLGPGFYFTEDPSESSDYAVRTTDILRGKLPEGNPNVLPVYLKITNPFPADSFKRRLFSRTAWKDPRAIFGYDFFRDLTGGNEAATDKLKKLGYDGIKAGHHWIAFYPTQIKSVFNKGTFNPQAEEITEDFSS